MIEDKIDYEQLTLKELVEIRLKSDNEYKKRIAARYEANKALKEAKQ